MISLSLEAIEVVCWDISRLYFSLWLDVRWRERILLVSLDLRIALGVRLLKRPCLPIEFGDHEGLIYLRLKLMMRAQQQVQKPLGIIVLVKLILLVVLMQRLQYYVINTLLRAIPTSAPLSLDPHPFLS